MNDDLKLASRPAARCRPPRRRRNGFTMTELVVSAALLITVMSFVTTLCFQINSVWKDIGHHRVATGELSNQLESLSRLSPEQAQLKLDTLVASETCARTLDRPELTGELIEDNLGFRVVLQINWKRRYPGQPIQLAGWLDPSRSEEIQ